MATETITVPFGVGALYLTDNATPAKSIYVGGLQELALKITRTSKGFKGEYLFDVLRALTGAECSLTAKFGAFKPTLIGSVLGGTVTAGYRALVKDESTGIISGATYTAANPTGFEDKGVNDENGAPLTRVTSTPGATEYSVTTGGVYTFNSAANGKVWSICYTWTASAVTGQTVTLNNALMAAPSTWYQIDAFNPSEKTGFVIDKAIPKSLNLPRKNDDFLVQDIEFDVIPSAIGRIGRIYLGA